MRTFVDVIEDGATILTREIGRLLGFYGEEEEIDMNMRVAKMTGVHNGIANTTITVAENILDDFRKTVGKHHPETGGMLACSEDMNKIDTWCFDRKSINTSASYEYDVQEMSDQFKKWKESGIRSVGFVHSHPSSYRQPSYDDIATARALMKFFQNDFFYLPIIISDRKGLFTMYFFVIRQVGLHLNVNLDYVQKATADGYELIPFRSWEENYSIPEVEAYYNRINGEEEKQDKSVIKETAKNILNVEPVSLCRPGYSASDKSAVTTYDWTKPITYYGMPYGRVIKKEPHVKKTERRSMKTDVKTADYFKKLEGMYPEKVLDKVIVCVGTGGARTVLENMARNGFRNYILIDGDKISPTNIATQGVFISEMGMWKTEAIKARINDINPNAKVICVNRFLDDEFSDEEFRVCLHNYKGKKENDFLVLGCCDTFEGNRRSSELSLKYGLPYIGAGMYQQGLAAEVIFVYPGVTVGGCPRCMLRSRYEAYEEDGYKNDVTSAGCSTFATERLNTLIGFISIMMLMYGEAPESPYNKMLDEVKDRNFVWIRMSPYLNQSELGIGIFDRVFGSPEVSRYTFYDETLWLPQHPDAPEFGGKPCKLCGGIRDLRKLKYKWADTRKQAETR